uniref:SEA domain-containing protein n=1 Tax=Otolemur garnettii TaxID=30611 RepID=H0XK98_OTOGA
TSEAWAGAFGMGILLAALLVVSISALPLLPPLEVPSYSPSAPDKSAVQSSNKKILLSLGTLTSAIAGTAASADRKGQAPGTRAGALSLEASGDQEAPVALVGSSGRNPPGPSPSALAKPIAHRPLKSQPESYVARRAEETWAPGSPEMAATSPSGASPGSHHLESGQKSSGAPGLSVIVHAPAPVALRTPVTLRPTQQSARAAPAPTPPAPVWGSPQLLAWLLDRHTLGPNTWTPSASGAGTVEPEASLPLTLAPGAPGKAESSVPQGRPVFTSIVNTLTVTEPLSAVAPELSGQAVTSSALMLGSGSPREAVASSLDPQPGGSSFLPSAAPSSWMSPSFSPHPLPALPLSSSPTVASLSLSPSLSPPPSPLPFQSLSLVPISPVTSRAGTFPDPSVSVFHPTATNSPFNFSNLKSALPSLMVPEPATLQGTAQPRPAGPAGLAPMATNLPPAPPSLDSSRVPKVANPTQSSALLHPGQAASMRDSIFSSPRPSHVTHFMTFRITKEAVVWSPGSWEHQLLSKSICQQLQAVYQEAFPSFEGINALVFRPSSGAVNASLIFGGRAPLPSACEVLWTLYHKVKASRHILGHLSLEENSLASNECDLTDLARETVSISFTAMRPFLPQLLIPGSSLFILLRGQILQQVTPLMSEFYKAHPQESLLLFFNNTDQWVNVYIEYKFQTPIPAHLQGLANYLAQKTVDLPLQKSSIVANGEKAELVLYEVWLQILGQPFTKDLEDKTSPEFLELQRLLMRWLTTILSPLQNFGQVVVEEFRPDPLTARVGVTFFRSAPAQAIVQDCVRRGLYALWQAEGLFVEVIIPDLG